MSDVLPISRRPEGYQPPTYGQVSEILVSLKKRRQPVIDRIWEVKRVRRGQWQEVIEHIPRAYRKMLLTPDLPVVRDMIQRVVGLIVKNEPSVEVIPPSGRSADVNKAAKEESRLNGLRIQIEDQQDRATYAMGIDAQSAWGESWISVWPDPRAFEDADYKRGKDESADDYMERYSELMANGGVPLCFEDQDPITVFPFYTDRNRLGICMVESEHQVMDIELGMGYKPITDTKGVITSWAQGPMTLSEPYIPNEARSDSARVDTTHVLESPTSTNSGGSNMADRVVKKVVFMDCWTYQCYIDGIKVEQWEHNYGCVPIFPAAGEQTSDRDPGYQSVGIADAAIAVAKNVIFFAAVMASNAMQHGFPTPFLENPAHGLVHGVTGEPLVRKIAMGEMNLLGTGEKITFPYLDAKMMPDFYRHMDWLTQQLEGTTLSNFGKAMGTDMAGYAIAQIRSMQLSILSTIYTNAARQWRKIFYFIRHVIRQEFPSGIYLRGAVEMEKGTGQQFRPVMRYGKSDTTDFTINVHIPEGIQQDEIAERKSALEMMQAGVWSPRRVQEKTGVEDPAAEQDEIAVYRMANSQEADQNVLAMAMEMNAERATALSTTQQSSLFAQKLQEVKQRRGFMSGQPQNQGATPANATPSGQPVQQEAPAAPPPPAQIQGGGVPTTPGGAAGVTQTPVGAPG